MTLDELRQQAKEDISYCNCCGAPSKLYKMKLSSGMAAAICWLVSTHGTDWVHIPTELPKGILTSRDYSRLELWGLLERKPETDDPKKPNSGIWRATEKGVEFAKREIEVPSHVFIRSPGRRFEGFEDGTTDVVSALGDHFNYQEMMSGL